MGKLNRIYLLLIFSVGICTMVALLTFGLSNGMETKVPSDYIVPFYTILCISVLIGLVNVIYYRKYIVKTLADFINGKI